MVISHIRRQVSSSVSVKQRKRGGQLRRGAWDREKWKRKKRVGPSKFTWLVRGGAQEDTYEVTSHV